MVTSATQLKRLQEQIKKLRLENAQLRRQLRGNGRNKRRDQRALLRKLNTESASMLAPTINDSFRRARLLKTVTERMRQNPIPMDAKHFTREELHERP